MPFGIGETIGILPRSSKLSRPPASSESVSRRMSRQARRDTGPEIELRRELHRRGLRFRVGFRPLTGLRSTADVVFTRAKLAVYVDGCFWHGCPEHGTMPTSNRQWWQEKLERNKRRDIETDEALATAGWRVVRVWEHEDSAEAADRVERILNSDDPRSRLAG
jgi:DNA mismatch endonuclease (patch repair protein)